jgi:hypothetical protein
MPKKGSLRARLRKAGIRSYDVLIHDQPKEWLIKNFKQGATDYPVNVARLMRNIVWQTRERIVKGEKPPLKELIRTFWYMYIKPTLSRANSLTNETDQYAQLIDNIVYMVKDIQVMRYEDIGFRDENQAPLLPQLKNFNPDLDKHLLLRPLLLALNLTFLIIFNAFLIKKK